MSPASRFAEQFHGWAPLKGLRPELLELGRVEAIRACPPQRLLEPGALEALVLAAGLNHEGLEELPAALHPHCGQGLRIWQYPIQFGPYLRLLCALRVRSYLEVGVRHGGSFVLTAEVLERFGALDFAVGVDFIPCPSMPEYRRLNPRAEFVCLNTQTPAFAALLRRLQAVDLVFVDSHHQEAQCRREYEVLREVSQMIAFHDISNPSCPGVGVVWQEIKASGAHACFEFVETYPGLGARMGIGLAVRRERLAGLPGLDGVAEARG